MSFYDIEFTVPGNPKALKRHRTFQKGKFKGTYDPSEGDKADFLVKAMENKPDIPFNEPLGVCYTYFFPRPKNHYRTGAFANEMKDVAPKWHTSKPDVDNLNKFINDALAGTFWKDDSIICSETSYKYYGDSPHILIQITRLNKFT